MTWFNGLESLRALYGRAPDAEQKVREDAAKEARENAKVECAEFLFEKLTHRDWSHLIALMDAAGWATQAQALRNWEPASKAA